MKRVFIISPFTGKIGPNTFLLGLVKHLILAEHIVTILYPKQDDIAKDMAAYGADLIYCKELQFKHISSFITKLFYRFYSEYKLSLYFRKFSNWDYDFCIINTEILSFSLRSLKKKPIYVMVHSLSFSENSLSKIIFRIQGSFVSKYIAVSDAVKEELQKCGVKKMISRVYNGIDLELFHKSVNGFTCVEDRPFSILSAVHPLPHKGAHLLLEVLSNLKKSGKIRFTCRVVGWFNTSNDAVYIKDVERKIIEKDLKDNIIFVSPTIEIRDELNDADLYVHPSLNESFGYILAEAMAYKLPVVAFEVGGIREVVQNNETGLLIPPYDCQQMSKSIGILMDDIQFRKSLGERGHQRVGELFDINQNMKQLIRELN